MEGVGSGAAGCPQRVSHRVRHNALHDVLAGARACLHGRAALAAHLQLERLGSQPAVRGDVRHIRCAAKIQGAMLAGLA